MLLLNPLHDIGYPVFASPAWAGVSISVSGKYLQDSSYFMEDAMPEVKWSRKDLYGQGISKVDITQPDHNVDKAMLNILDCVLV